MCLRHHNDDERLTKPPLRKQWTILSGLSVKDCLLFVFNEVGKFETIRDSSLIHQCFIQSSGSTSPQRLLTLKNGSNFSWDLISATIRSQEYKRSVYLIFIFCCKS